jgi:glycyl-tRNA synthetase beta chain
MHITNASEYHKQFASYFQTKTHIQLQLQQHYKELNANNAVDENLLDEVSGLCENPKVLQGTIPQQYMNIPHCILESTMKINQRYFPIYKPDGSLLNRFLFVADNVSQNNQQCIIDGNAKVLNARLADAQYFYNEDVKTFGNITIEDAEKWLEKMPFHTQLGSMYHKTQRIEYIFHKIANKNISDAKNIIPFIKLDLATKVVQEFPELQGKIGAEYYKRFWHNKPDDHYVISDQYGTFIRKELSLSQRLILIANALEHIACQFTIGNKPTSSGDPFAVRRYGNNLVNWTLSNIYENTINLDLSAESLSCILPAEIATHANEIATFLSERILRCKQN